MCRGQHEIAFDQILAENQLAGFLGQLSASPDQTTAPPRSARRDHFHGGVAGLTELFEEVHHLIVLDRVIAVGGDGEDAIVVAAGDCAELTQGVDQFPGYAPAA